MTSVWFRWSLFPRGDRWILTGGFWVFFSMRFHICPHGVLSESTLK